MKIDIDLTQESESLRTTFLSLFNGARRGYIWPNGSISFGKAEAEWGWPSDWERLKELGIVKFDLTDQHVEWEITNLGYALRDVQLADIHRRTSDGT